MADGDYNERDQSRAGRNGSVAVRAHSNRGGESPVVVVDHFKDDSLTLAEHPENRTLQGARSQEHFGPIIVTDDDPDTGEWVIHLDHALNRQAQAFTTLPARMQDVQTRALRVFDP